MPWETKSVKTMKEEFIQLSDKKDISFSELCRRFSISRKTGYKWLKRHKEQGLTGLDEQSKRPKNSPHKTCDKIENIIVEARSKHNRWGGRKIRHFLLNQGYNEVPAASTITDILRRHGLVDLEISEQQKDWIRFEHEHPNDLWQMDFKGHFAMADGNRCHPLTIIDDHSRYAVSIDACLNEQLLTTKTALRNIFMKFGLPKRINVDNGSPWGATFAECRYTEFGLWVIDQGVIISYSRPRHPQTNGKNERFNRTLKSEVIDNTYIQNIQEAQRLFTNWKDIYNYQRPHEALDYKTPSERYRPSYRSFQENVEEYYYSNDYTVKSVDSRGRIHMGGRSLFVGVPFKKRYVGLRQVNNNENELALYYRQQPLGKFSLLDIPKGDCISIYSLVK